MEHKRFPIYNDAEHSISTDKLDHAAAMASSEGWHQISVVGEAHSKTDGRKFGIFTYRAPAGVTLRDWFSDLICKRLKLEPMTVLAKRRELREQVDLTVR